jgi:hypothetical protein
LASLVVAWGRAWFRLEEDLALVGCLGVRPVVDWNLVDCWVGQQPVDSAPIDFWAVQLAVDLAAPDLSSLDVAGLRCDWREDDTPALTASRPPLHDP